MFEPNAYLESSRDEVRAATRFKMQTKTVQTKIQSRRRQSHFPRIL